MAESFGLLQPMSSESNGCIGDYFTYNGIMGSGSSRSFTLNAGNQERRSFLVTVLITIPSTGRFLIGTTIVPTASEIYGIGSQVEYPLRMGTLSRSGNTIQYTVALQIQSMTIVVIGL